MPGQPSSKQVHVNRPLTNISIAFKNQLEDYVADKVFPMLPVSKQGDLYYIYDKDNWFRSQSAKRAPGTESAGSGFTLTTDSYFADVWAIHKNIADQERANQDEPIDLDRDSTEFVTEQQMLRKEKEWIDNFFKTGVWTVDFTPATLWDAAGSDPIIDVRTKARDIKRLTGKKPNKLIVSGEVHDALVDNAAIIDRINGGSTTARPGLVTRELLAQVFEVDEYLVAEAIENTAIEGDAFVGAEIAGKNALLVYSEPNPGLKKPSGGYTFTWTGLLGGRAGSQMKKFRMEELASDRVESEMAWDQKLVAADLGVFFAAVIS